MPDQSERIERLRAAGNELKAAADALVDEQTAEIDRLRAVLKHSHDRSARQGELLKRACSHIDKTQSLFKEIHEELYPPPEAAPDA